jgi:hypothetical protein
MIGGADYGLGHIPALELPPTRAAAVRRLKVARLALKLFLATGTPLLHQERTLGACHVIRVTVMVNGGMAANGPSLTAEATLGRPRTARLRWLKYGSTAVAADFMKDCLWTAAAWASMAHLLAIMATALERSSTGPDADMLRLDGVDITSGPVLPSCCLPLRGLSLPLAAVFATLVAATAQVGLASSHAQGVLNIPLMTYRLGACSATSARNIHRLIAESAVASVALRPAQVTAGKKLLAGPVAVRNAIFTGLPWLI